MTNDPADKTFHPSRRGFLGVAAATGAASLARGVLVGTAATTAALADAFRPVSSQSVEASASAIAAKLPSPTPGYLSFGPDEAGFVEVPQELILVLECPEPAGTLADLAASFVDIKPKEKPEILESVDLVVARIDKVARLLSERIEVLSSATRWPVDQGDVRRETAQGSP
ncbi:hypothetical protein DPM33_20490 [Mesorhizobium hawassense]|uniref:Uncharacterized protein n=1 Tax=Mesorhizobium hawassense TaxID=1209954 RepID=A0A330HJC6_9HYPH|nr:hypothetical protein DPM33_20490 [Mesorhizobium hawassense]